MKFATSDSIYHVPFANLCARWQHYIRVDHKVLILHEGSEKVYNAGVGKDGRLTFLCVCLL